MKSCVLLFPVMVACSSNGDFSTALNQDDGGPSGGAMSGGAPGAGGSAGHSAGGTGARATGGRSNGGASSGGSGGSAGRPGTGGLAGSGGGIAGMPSVCPGAAPAPAGYPPCRTSADCPSTFDVCMHDPATGCGVGPPQPQCYADTDCTNGQLCLVITPAGCSGEASHCVAPCTNTSCAADEICAASGHCAPKPCSAGYTCGPGTVCGPSRSGADAHGCAPASCSTDGYVCLADYRCAPSSSADVHGCSPVLCTEGYVCPPNFDCNPTSTALHHCDRLSCTTDADCDCGACIVNRCEDRLFVCSMLPS